MFLLHIIDGICCHIV